MSWQEYCDLLVKFATTFALMLAWCVVLYPLARRREWAWPRLLVWSGILTLSIAAAKEWLDTVSPVYDQVLSYGLGLFLATACLSYGFQRLNRPLAETTTAFKPDTIPLRHLLKVGIQLEREGEALYRRLAEEADSPETRTMCLSLAGDERQHALWLTEFTYRWLPRSRLKERTEALRQWALDYTLFSSPPKEDVSPEALFAYALKQEHAFVEFYQSFSTAYPSCWQQLKLARVIEEERSHIRQLEEKFGTVGSSE